MTKQLVIIKETCQICNGSGGGSYGKCNNNLCNYGYVEIEIDLNKWLENKLKELEVIIYK